MEYHKWEICRTDSTEVKHQGHHISALPYILLGLTTWEHNGLNLWFFVSRLSWVNVTCNTISRSKGQRSRSLCLIKSRHKVHH